MHTLPRHLGKAMWGYENMEEAQGGTGHTAWVAVCLHKNMQM